MPDGAGSAGALAGPAGRCGVEANHGEKRLLRMQVKSSTRAYVLGHSELELLRLERQGDIFAEETEATLRAAGLKQGDRVLDIGSGVGDVALIAARIVGPTGQVLGIDRSAEALDYARRRAKSAGYDWVTFQTNDLNELPQDKVYDALTGRFILMYLSAPGVALANLVRSIRPGGAVAFLEFDIDQSGAVPDLPLFTQCRRWITETYRKVGIEPNMGSGLYKAFRAAGLKPEIRGTTRFQGNGDTVAFDFAAETIRSLLPRMEQLGVASQAEVDLETLVPRLQEAAEEVDSCILLPRLVGAWARKPA
jgi:ubiquinone/menaquinone biosynthesis C-methylase UbiE